MFIYLYLVLCWCALPAVSSTCTTGSLKNSTCFYCGPMSIVRCAHGQIVRVSDWMTHPIHTPDQIYAVVLNVSITSNHKFPSDPTQETKLCQSILISSLPPNSSHLTIAQHCFWDSTWRLTTRSHFSRRRLNPELLSIQKQSSTILLIFITRNQSFASQLSKNVADDTTQISSRIAESAKREGYKNLIVNFTRQSIDSAIRCCRPSPLSNSSDPRLFQTQGIARRPYQFSPILGIAGFIVLVALVICGAMVYCYFAEERQKNMENHFNHAVQCRSREENSPVTSSTVPTSVTVLETRSLDDVEIDPEKIDWAAASRSHAKVTEGIAIGVSKTESPERLGEEEYDSMDVENGSAAPQFASESHSMQPRPLQDQESSELLSRRIDSSRGSIQFGIAVTPVPIGESLSISQATQEIPKRSMRNSETTLSLNHSVLVPQLSGSSLATSSVGSSRSGTLRTTLVDEISLNHSVIHNGNE